MATWAYECVSCDDKDTIWYAPQFTVDQFPPSVTIVRVKVGSRWLCAAVDRSHRVAVEGLLVREVISTEAANCMECQDE